MRLLDVATTLVGFSIGLDEANPLFKSENVPWMLAYQALLLGLVAGAFVYFYKKPLPRMRAVFLWIMFAQTVAGFFVVTHNISLILRVASI